MDTQERADRARAILNDEVFAGAVAAIRERQLAAFENSTPERPEVREQAHAMLCAITQLVGELQSAIDDNTIKKGRHRGNHD